MFAWYIFTSGSSTFDSILQYGDYVFNQLSDFFNPHSRDPAILRGLGMEAAPHVLNAISRTFAYLTEALIVAGFVGLITRRIQVHIDRDRFAINVAAMVFLALLILVPGLASTLNMTRFYHILLFFLAPLCGIGAKLIVKLIFKQDRELIVSILLLIIIAPYFLFQTSFVYEVAGSESWSLPLSKYRMNRRILYLRFGYIDDLKVFSAKWIGRYGDVKNIGIYTEVTALSLLVTYAMIPNDLIFWLSNVTRINSIRTVYVSPLNTIDGIIIARGYVWNITEFPFKAVNRIYTNGGSEIYRVPWYSGG